MVTKLIYYVEVSFRVTSCGLCHHIFWISYPTHNKPVGHFLSNLSSCLSCGCAIAFPSFQFVPFFRSAESQPMECLNSQSNGLMLFDGFPLYCCVEVEICLWSFRCTTDWFVGLLGRSCLVLVLHATKISERISSSYFDVVETLADILPPAQGFL